jgi:anti-sigma factor RsiW
MTCEQMRELAPALALGDVSGEERAGAIEHLSSCAACSALVEQLARVSDDLLLLAPQVEPQGGFESGVLARLRAERPRRWRRRALAAAAAAALLASGTTAAVVLAATHDDRTFAGYYRGVLARAQGKHFTAARLLDESGRQSGHVFAYEGRPSWTVLVKQGCADRTPLDVMLALRRGPARRLGTITPPSCGGAWAWRISAGAVKSLAVVRLVEPSGKTRYEAYFRIRR